MLPRTARKLLTIGALLIAALFLVSCAGVTPHGVVVVDTPRGPVEVRFDDSPPAPATMAKSIGRRDVRVVAWGSGNGAAVSTYHSAGQAKVLHEQGYIAVLERYAEPLDLQPGERLIWFYPFTATGWSYQLRQNRVEPGFNEVARRLHKRGVEGIAYLPKPTTGDAWQISTFEGQVREIERLIDCVPATMAVCFDEIASASAAGREAIARCRARGRKIYGEPFKFTYAPWAHDYETIENSDHEERTRNDPTRVPEARHTLILHHDPMPKEPALRSAPPGARTVTYQSAVRAWTMSVEKRGMRWIAQAEPLVNHVPQLRIADIAPGVN